MPILSHSRAPPGSIAAVAESFFIAKNHSGARFRSKRELAVTVGWGNPLFQWKVTEYSEGSIFKAAGRLIGPELLRMLA
jgi:hypothetical protein